MKTVSYVAVLPDNTEFFKDMPDDRVYFGNRVQQVAEEAVSHSEYRSERHNIRTLTVRVFTLVIQSGKITRTNCQTIPVVAPMKPMTKEEFEKELLSATRYLPAAFQEYVKKKAQENSNSYEVTIEAAVDLATELKSVLDAYCNWLIS